MSRQNRSSKGSLNTESGDEDELDVDLNIVVDSDNGNKIEVDAQAIIEDEKMDVHSKVFRQK